MHPQHPSNSSKSLARRTAVNIYDHPPPGSFGVSPSAFSNAWTTSPPLHLPAGLPALPKMGFYLRGRRWQRQ